MSQAARSVGKGESADGAGTSGPHLPNEPGERGGGTRGDRVVNKKGDRRQRAPGGVRPDAACCPAAEKAHATRVQADDGGAVRGPREDPLCEERVSVRPRRAIAVSFRKRCILRATVRNCVPRLPLRAQLARARPAA